MRMLDLRHPSHWLGSVITSFQIKPFTKDQWLPDSGWAILPNNWG